jgi:hypothetical protein
MSLTDSFAKLLAGNGFDYKTFLFGQFWKHLLPLLPHKRWRAWGKVRGGRARGRRVVERSGEEGWVKLV